MKARSSAFFAVLLLAPVVTAAQDLSGTFQYQSPQGSVGLVLQQTGAQVEGTLTGVDGQVSRLQGDFDGARAIGTISMGEATGWFAAGILGEGLTLIIAELDPASGEPNLAESWRLDFTRTGPAGDRTGATDSGSPLVQQWMHHLRGKKVTFTESYHSPGAGGFSNRWEAYLCSDMRFFFRSSGNVNADVGNVWGQSRDRNSFQGTWRIIEQGGQAILQYQRSELAGTDQGEWVALSLRNGQTFFDNSRVFVTSDNDACP
jgi:hypothetical protein